MQKSGKIAVTVSLLIMALLVVTFVFAKPSPTGIAACKDGLDNDGDGYTDYPNDPGCASRNDNSELNTAIQCDDGTDNDGDSAIDMNDAGCSSPTDNDESNCGDDICEGGEDCSTCQADCLDTGQVCCSGTAYTGDCCTNEDCTSPAECTNHICTIPDSCSDSDGGIYPFIFGTASGYLDEVFYSDSDYCVDSSNVMEHYCSGKYENSTQQSCGTDFGSNVCYLGDVYYNSTDYYCSAGACNINVNLTLVQDCVTGQYCSAGQCKWNNSCSDTDGGWNLELQGTITGYYYEVWYNNTDYCLNNETLSEYTCSGTYPYNWNISCVGNLTTQCYNGACI